MVRAQVTGDRIVMESWRSTARHDDRGVNATAPARCLEDDVELGAYALVLGGVRSGKGCRLGARVGVFCDVPLDCIAVW